MKKVVVVVMIAALALAGIGFAPSEASAASIPAKKIVKVGSASKSYEVGTKFELEVKKGKKVRDKHLWWTVQDTKILKYADKDRADDDIDLIALKTGKTKVYCKNKLTGKKITYTITVKKASTNIAAIGKSSRSVNKGSEFELEVKMGGAVKPADIQWSVSDESIVAFEDSERNDDDMDFVAINTGTVKITAKNIKTGSTVVYNITVK